MPQVTLRSTPQTALQQVFLGFAGLAAGGVIAAGVFAFLAIIGVFPRLVGKTKTRQHILLYDTLIVLGGVAGNTMDLYEIPMVLPGGSLMHGAVLGVFGLAVGVFVGCLVMSLAETLKTVPVITRRIHLAVGLQYVILSIAAGKLVGSLVYFICGIAA
ncbi:MAG: stage V sporulation protein AB [Lachnospiraceae bacterium]|nr:stage V sporulation protein AB [Lachnospiraceae bacterium]